MEKLNLKEFVAVAKALISTKEEVVSVAEAEMVKNGDIWYGLKIQTKAGENEPIYLNGYYREYISDKTDVRQTVCSVMKLVCTTNSKITDTKKDAANSKINNSENKTETGKKMILKNVILRIVNCNNNICGKSAKICIGDMCVVFETLHNHHIITNEECEQHNISIEELRSEALKNSAEKMPLKVCHEGKTEAGVPYYLLSNTEEQYGASVVLYPGVLKKFAEIFDDDLHIIPLTTDFMMLMPAGKVDSLSLSVSLSIVTDDIKEKSPEMFVSDMLYRYIKDEDSIICEDLVYIP